MNEHVPKAKIARSMFARREGATMREIISVTGGPHYNELKRIRAQGHVVREIKEGNETRYFATAPAPSYEATMTSKGQVTFPKEVRERLRLRAGHKVRFTFQDGDRMVVAPVETRFSDLAGLLGKPKRSVTLEEMDEAIRQGAVDRYLRAVGKKR